MAIICPTITAYDPHEYRAQIEQIENFAERIHVDMMDGMFTSRQSVDLEHVWWPDNITADIHLMYQRPGEVIDGLVKHNPSLVVIHYEADADHRKLAAQLRDHDIKAGLAILQDTEVEEVLQLLESFDHVLVFSGKLGFHGGQADLRYLEKVNLIREKFPKIEISWDGGINDKNAKQLVDAGVDVLNTGGSIQNSTDPQSAYATLKSVIEG